MLEVSQKSIKWMTALVVLMLLYAIIINVEQIRGSHRYIVQARSVDGGLKYFECLDMMAGVTREMELERDKQMTQVTREKMTILSKWLTCGVL